MLLKLMKFSETTGCRKGKGMEHWLGHEYNKNRVYKKRGTHNQYVHAHSSLDSSMYSMV